MSKTRIAAALDYDSTLAISLPKDQHTSKGTFYTIGDLAREFDVTLRALRFYEDKGLLNPSRDGLTRLYSAQDREHLKLILKGKSLGFTLVEISEMIAHQGEGKSPRLKMSVDTVKEQIAHLERQRLEIDEALAELRKSYQTLAKHAR
jgi:DNA-binding transcriptional MerR regulator